MWNVLWTSQREYGLKNNTKKTRDSWNLFCFVFFPQKKESHSSQNEYLDINVDGLEHYKQPTDLLEQAI